MARGPCHREAGRGIIPAAGSFIGGFTVRHDRSFALLLAVLAAVVTSAGCSTVNTPFPDRVRSSYRFGMFIDSIAAPEAAARGRTYVLAPGIKDLREDDLEYRTLSRYAETALAQQGYQRVASDQEAALLIRFGYGTGTPQVTATTYATSTGFAYPVGDLWFSVPARTSTTQVSDYPITVVLEAYDLRAPSRSPLWRTTITGHSRVPNNVPGGIFVVTYFDIPEFRIQVPYLLAGASDRIGTDTGSRVTVQVVGDDPRVPVIMGRPSP